LKKTGILSNKCRTGNKKNAEEVYEDQLKGNFFKTCIIVDGKVLQRSEDWDSFQCKTFTGIRF
jgi:hypothetical protein